MPDYRVQSWKKSLSLVEVAQWQSVGLSAEGAGSFRAIPLQSALHPHDALLACAGASREPAKI